MKEELTIHDIQAVSLEIMKQFSDLCEKQHLRYTLIYGTLIGAIRHNGYIPWDDDVDIMMPRPDYDKLMIYLSSHKLPNLTVFNRQTCPSYPYMISRLSDDRYILKMENEESVGMGIFIDIFPYDGIGSVKWRARLLEIKGDFLSSCCYQASRKHYAIENTSSTVRKALKYPLYLFAKLIGKDYFQNQLEKMARRMDYDKSKFVGCITWLNGGWRDIFHRSFFDETIMHPFEKYQFRIPKNYDMLLRHTYGDYMQMPPEDKRTASHYYKAYKKE